MYWLFQRSKDGFWDGIEDSEWEKLRGEVVIAGRTHLVEAKNLAEALSTVVPVEEVIRRAMKDEEDYGIAYCYQKWFGNLEDEENDEDGGTNKEAVSLLAEYSKRL